MPVRFQGPIVLASLLLLVACRDRTPETMRWEAGQSLGQRGQALAQAGDRLYAFVDGRLNVSLDRGATWDRPASAGLPRGEVVALHAIDGEVPALLAFAFGHGLFRSEDEGASWQPIEREPRSELLGLLNPRAKVVPFGMAQAGEETLLAGAGGLFRSRDEGRTFEGAGPESNVLFTSVAALGERRVATAQVPEYLLPKRYKGVLRGRLFLSENGGRSWFDNTDELEAHAPVGAAFSPDGTAWIAAMDGGLYRMDPDGEIDHVGGPADAMAVSWSQGGVNVASGARGLWRFAEGEWTYGDAGPVAALADDFALGHDGRLWRLAKGRPVPPPAGAGGTVYVALSFHTNLYHSYRGDEMTEDGFGMDIRVMRIILDWLDRHPRVHGDWDIENHFSVDGWLKEHAPDVIERIRDRVQAGQDGLRLMSWNNGAMTAKCREEFSAAVRLAKESYLEAFGRFDPGVQPQECMFTPEHVGWYRAEGIEWITLFNSATPFTAIRQDLHLKGRELYNPLRLVDGEDSMILVPVYHPGDLMNHGGLAAWARQIHDTQPGDSLLVVHMDADAEVWENFDQQLPLVEALPFVKFTTIQQYLDSHEPVASVTLPGDVADGTGDGYQSWAEKDFNHRIFTRIVRARSLVDFARELAPEDPEVELLAESALEARLVALSTTHFGLAAPVLHPQRVDSTERTSSEALAAAQAALAAAEAGRPVAPGAIEVTNARDAAGPALVDLFVPLPAAGVSPEDFQRGLRLFDGERELATAVVAGNEGAEVTVVLDLLPRQSRLLSWRFDPEHESPSPAPADPITSDALEAPFTECRGATATGLLDAEESASLPGRRTTSSRWKVKLCEADGEVTRRRTRYEGLPGTVVEVSATLGETARPLDAESVALTPFACAGDAVSLRWRTFGGRAMERPVRPGQQTWNGQAADGWVAVVCDDGKVIQIAHRVTNRTSMAFAPLRNDQGRAIVAPLGTLWGAPPWHDARRDGGHGLGDVVVGLIGAQFRPAAPDWSGRTVRYRLLVGEDLPEEVLDLFAHPPMARVGPASEP